MRSHTLRNAASTAVALLALTACVDSSADRETDAIAEGEDVHVGAMLALTGVYAGQGAPSRNGLELAIEQANEDGGANGHKIVLEVEDTAAQPQQAVSLLSQFAARSDIVAVVGPSTSAEAPAVAPVANEMEIPLIAATAISEELITSGEWSFRVRIPPADVATFLADAGASKLGINKLAVVYPADNEGSTALAKMAEKLFSENGADVSVEAVQSTNTDFSSVVTKVRATEPDAIYCPCPIPVAAGVLSQARKSGVPDDVHLIGEFYDVSQEFVKIGGPEVQGAYFPSDYSPSADVGINAEFVEAYESKYSELPDPQAAAGYTAGTWLVEALSNVEGDLTRSAVRKALADVRELPSVLGQGTWRQDENRLSSLDLLLVQLDGNEFVPVNR